NVLGVQYLLPVHKQKEFTISVTLGAFVNVILNVPLIHLWGLNGAMIATSVSEFSVTAYQLFTVRHLLDFKNLFYGSWKYFISSLIMFVVVFWMNRNLRDTWLMMFIEILVGILVYGILVIILKAPIIEQVRKLKANRLKR
nr:polysaccharide biosynthesis C-terminal domain-containing protein [Lactobacillus amylovorus]